MKTRRISSITLRLAALSIIILAPASATGQDVLLPCPPPIMDSTADIQNALFETRNGGTVHLGACTYYLTHAIEARWNHHGTITGQGKDQTFIKILPGYKIDGVYMSVWDGSFSTLFLFENPESGDITISDLSIVVTDPEPAGLQDDPPGRPGWWQGSLYNMIVVTGPNVHTRFERSSFRGAPGNFFGAFNVAHVAHVFSASDQMKGSHTVTDCDFTSTAVTVNPWGYLDSDFTGNTFVNTYYGPAVDNCGNCTVNVSQNLMIDVQVGTFFDNLWDSQIQVMDNYITGNGSVAVHLENLLGSTIDVAGNSTFGPSGVFVWQSWWVDRASVFNLHENVVQQRPSSDYAGFEIWDESTEISAKSDFIIASNQIHNEGSAFWGPVFTFRTRGAEIIGNRITGSGPAAMYLGAVSSWGADDSYMYVADNDVLGFTPKMHKLLAGDVIPSHYWYGALTSYNTIVGQEAASDRVFDEGQSNTIIGAMHIQQGRPDDHPGQSMFDESAAVKNGTVLNALRN